MTDPSISAAASKPAWLKPTIDYLPVVALFVGFFVGGRDLTRASWWLVGGSIASIGISLALTRRVPPLPLISGSTAIVFGTLTLIFHDPVFVKMKTTFVDGGAQPPPSLIGLRLGKEPPEGPDDGGGPETDSDGGLAQR